MQQCHRSSHSISWCLLVLHCLFLHVSRVYSNQLGRVATIGLFPPGGHRYAIHVLLSLHQVDLIVLSLSFLSSSWTVHSPAVELA